MEPVSVVRSPVRDRAMPPSMRPATHPATARTCRLPARVRQMSGRTALHGLALGLLLAACLASPGAAFGQGWEARSAPGLRLEYAAEDRAVAERLWPALEADRLAVMEALRLFPPEPVRVVLAPTLDAFHAQLGGSVPAGTLGVYLLGRGTIVLRSPRTEPSANWDLRGVLRHELAHAIIDLAISQPVPIWLHEGLAILVSNELSYLDEAQLTTVAVLGRLIPLPVLFESFPGTHGARTLAYTQAASFVRFLLREGGMGAVQRLLEAMARGVALDDAFLRVYSEPLAGLEARWQGELAERFSLLTLVTTSSVLGGLGLPLVLAAALRRYLQRRRAYRAWEQEERLRAAVRGAPDTPAGSPGAPSAPPGAEGEGRPASRRVIPWRPPRPRREEQAP
jgi:hypothetical protein